MDANYLKNFKNLMNLVHCQKQLECHQHILKKIRFVKIIFIKPLRFVKAHVDLSKDRSSRRTHDYSINLIIKPTVKNKMSLRCSEKEKFLSSFRVLFRLGLWLKMRFVAMSITTPSLSLTYSSQVSIIKISHFKHIINWPIQDFS